MTIIFAHRGAHNDYPENSIAAFKEAVNLGVGGIETDIHLTKDDEPIIMHDESLKRTTGVKRNINELTLAELKSLRLENSDEKIPTLFELLEYLNEINFSGTLNLEIKTDRIHYQNIEEIVVNSLNEFSPKYQVIFSSFYAPSLVRLHKIANIECALLFKQNDRQAQRLYQDGIIQSFHPRYFYIFRKKSSITMRPWTINSTRSIKRCLKYNVAGIFTDYPKLAMQIEKDIKFR